MNPKLWGKRLRKALPSAWRRVPDEPRCPCCVLIIAHVKLLLVIDTVWVLWRNRSHIIFWLSLKWPELSRPLYYCVVWKNSSYRLTSLLKMMPFCLKKRWKSYYSLGRVEALFFPTYFDFKKKSNWSPRNGSVLKRNSCASRDPRFNSQNPLTTVYNWEIHITQGALSSAFHEPQAHRVRWHISLFIKVKAPFFIYKNV